MRLKQELLHVSLSKHFKTYCCSVLVILVTFTFSLLRIHLMVWLYAEKIWTHTLASPLPTWDNKKIDVDKTFQEIQKEEVG